MKKSFFYVSGFFFVYAFNASVVVDMHTHFEFRCIFHNCFFVFIENQYSLSKILFDSMVDKQCRFYCIEKKKKKSITLLLFTSISFNLSLFLK